MSAAFDDELIKSVGSIVGMEGRAFNNYGRAGLDFWTPNINPFKDPRWGRGQETPGEDPYHLAQYVYNLVVGLQGGLDPEPYYQVVSTCKHFAGYDLEDWYGTVRYGFNAVITSQDLAEYYLPSFQSCYRDAKVGAAMFVLLQFLVQYYYVDSFRPLMMQVLVQCCQWCSFLCKFVLTSRYSPRFLWLPTRPMGMFKVTLLAYSELMTYEQITSDCGK
jgi:hypothetical protein